MHHHAAHPFITATVAAAWVLATTLMVVARLDQSLEVYFWAAFIAIGSTMPTAWLIVDHLVRAERDRTERLVAVVLRQAMASNDGDGDGGGGPDNLHWLRRSSDGGA